SKVLPCLTTQLRSVSEAASSGTQTTKASNEDSSKGALRSSWSSAPSKLTVGWSCMPLGSSVGLASTSGGDAWFSLPERSSQRCTCARLDASARSDVTSSNSSERASAASSHNSSP